MLKDYCNEFRFTHPLNATEAVRDAVKTLLVDEGIDLIYEAATQTSRVGVHASLADFKTVRKQLEDSLPASVTIKAMAVPVENFQKRQAHAARLERLQEWVREIARDNPVNARTIAENAALTNAKAVIFRMKGDVKKWASVDTAKLPDEAHVLDMIELCLSVLFDREVPTHAETQPSTKEEAN